MGTKEDLEIGRSLLALFTPFIQNLIDEGLAKKTIKNHGSHLGILGREIIRRLARRRLFVGSVSQGLVSSQIRPYSRESGGSDNIFLRGKPLE